MDITAQEYQQAWETGELASHSYIRDNFGPVKVPPGDYFVMGDNRDGSFDARFWGPLPNRLLKGKGLVCVLAIEPDKGDSMMHDNYKYWLIAAAVACP